MYIYKQLYIYYMCIYIYVHVIYIYYIYNIIARTTSPYVVPVFGDIIFMFFMVNTFWFIRSTIIPMAFASGSDWLHCRMCSVGDIYELSPNFSADQSPHA